MKRILLIVGAIVLLLLGGPLLLHVEPDQQAAKQKISTLSDQIQLVEGQIIDVREPDEYTANHADEAVNVPLGDILNGDFSKIDKDKPIYVYCRTGNRAEQAKIALEKAGYKNITNIGGLADWQAQGDKVCSTSAPSC